MKGAMKKSIDDLIEPPAHETLIQGRVPAELVERVHALQKDYQAKYGKPLTWTKILSAALARFLDEAGAKK